MLLNQQIDVIGGTNISTNFRYRIDEMNIKGHVLIFNQEFKDKPNYRVGSNRDVESLCKTFGKLGLKQSVKCDMNLKEIQDEIEIRKYRYGNINPTLKQILFDSIEQ